MEINKENETNTGIEKQNVSGEKDFAQKVIATYQSAFLRVKKILFNTQNEFQTINRENMPYTKVLTSYVLPLTAIAAVIAFIGWGLIGYPNPVSSHYGNFISEVASYYGNSSTGYGTSSAGYGIKMAIALFVLLAGGIYLTSLIVNFISENFGAPKNFDKAFSLVAYSCTPMMLGGIFHLIPSISWLWLLASACSFYLLYIGLKPMMQVSEEKKMPYLAISIGAIVVVFFILGWLLGRLLTVSVFGNISL